MCDLRCHTRLVRSPRFISRNLTHADVLTVRNLLADWKGEALDLIVGSPGGDIEVAYFLVRELRRRTDHLGIFVPFRAKSAPTLLCLAAEELILGSLGKLGPLDQQYDQTQRADFSSGSEGLLVVVWSGLGRNLMSQFEGRSG
jgi:ClpP class serine protease